MITAKSYLTSLNAIISVSGGFLFQFCIRIERRDRVINLCEMKFSVNEFIIDKEYDMVLRNKLETFRKLNDCKQSLQITMITTYGVKNNKYSGFAGSQVILDDLFHE